MLGDQGKGAGTDSTLRARLGHLPANSNAILYLDLTTIRTAGVEAAIPADSKADYDAQAAPFVRPLQYLLAGGTSTLNGTVNHSRSVFFLGIGK